MASCTAAPVLAVSSGEAPDVEGTSRRWIEIAHRGRILLDWALTELALAERRLGAFHETTWMYRRATADARTAWDRLRAEFGQAALDDALLLPPATVMTVGHESGPGELPRAVLLVAGGRTYRAEKLTGTPPAPVLWRLDRLPPADPADLADDPFALDPYHVARLADGTTRCDCGEWIFKVDGVAEHPTGVCKHLAALRALGWV